VSSPSPSEPQRTGLDLHRPLPATWLFLAAVVANHLASGARWWGAGRGTAWQAWCAGRGVRQRIEAGGGYGPLIDRGATWRLWTSVLVHVDALHLLTNVASLWVLGRLLEPLIGGWRLGAVAWAGGVAGALVSHAAGHTQSDGASGAGFAWMGAAVAIGALRRTSLPADDARLLGPVLGGFLALNLVASVALPFVDLTAHLGGLAVGALAGVALARPPRPLGTAAAAAVVLGSAAVVGWGAYRVYGGP